MLVWSFFSLRHLDVSRAPVWMIYFCCHEQLNSWKAWCCGQAEHSQKDLFVNRNNINTEQEKWGHRSSARWKTSHSHCEWLRSKCIMRKLSYQPTHHTYNVVQHCKITKSIIDDAKSNHRLKADLLEFLNLQEFVLLAKIFEFAITQR